MKTRIISIIALLASLLVPAGSFAVETNFAAGSLIIPMDSFYQPEADNGILEAYGMVYQLLAHTEVIDGIDKSDITIHWLIDPDKTTIDGPDLTIEVTDTVLASYGVNAVAELYNNDKTSSPLPAYRTGDSYQKMSYTGSVFVIELPDVVKADNIINDPAWDAVEIHIAKVPFKSQVFRKMKGTPPRIAVMDSDESGTGNAEILESYLRLAGICPDNYEVLTPNQIRDGLLNSGDFEFLWAPHWTGYETYNGDGNNNNKPDVEDIISEVRVFLRSGKALLAECASIEVFEHSANGHFLASNSFGHNMGTQDANTIIYNDMSQPYSQVGDFPYVPEGGHLHNWRPYKTGDDYNDIYKDGVNHAPTANSFYNDTVTRFTIDDGSTSPSAAPYYDTTAATDESGWDYYVGGYMDGDTNNGYVVYLGGHKYAECSTTTDPDSTATEKEMKFEYCDDVDSGEVYTITFNYTYGTNTGTTTITVTGGGFTTTTGGDPLSVTSLEVKDKKIEKVMLNNIGTEGITITDISFSWTQSGQGGLVKLEDKTGGEKYLDLDKDDDCPSSVTSVTLPTDALVIQALVTTPPSTSSTTFCTDNADCTPTNVSGVRYVLNTLFNIGYTIEDREFARSAPIIDPPYLYQGSFEYPGYSGHFRRYDIEKELVEDALGKLVFLPDWDTGDDPGLIPSPDTGNALNLNRLIYTAYKPDSVTDQNNPWVILDFDADTTNLTVDSRLQVPLDVTPNNGDDWDEFSVIERVRGKNFNPTLGVSGEFVEKGNKLGGIVHSAPVIVTTNSRFTRTDEVAFVGDVHGMLHAIKTRTGEEMWAFIPPSLLGKLQNDRTDPNAPSNFAAVDGSPIAKDIYYEAPGETGKSWHTILISTLGYGGNSVFTLDITSTNAEDDPFTPVVDTWKLLWESTSADMGHSRRAALGKIKSPIFTNGDITGYETKWVVYVATGFANYDPNGGINVYAFDLDTGTELWHFSRPYTDSINDMPGSITLYDLDHDTFTDRVYVGDMNGRLWELYATDVYNSDSPNTLHAPGGVSANFYPTKEESQSDTFKSFDPAKSVEYPLYQAGGPEGSGILENIGVGYPISISPAIYRSKGDVILIGGTGGTDWASDTKIYSLFAVNATQKIDPADMATTGFAGTVDWETGHKTEPTDADPLPALPAGEKIWSAPTIYGGHIYLATTIGTLESSNPIDDILAAGEKGGTLYKIGLHDGIISDSMDIGKTRGSIFVADGQLYLTTLDNQVIQVGDREFGNRSLDTVIKSWRLQ